MNYETSISGSIITGQNPVSLFFSTERKNGPETYRFGFNGKENDNEVKGTGNQQDYGMRIYDPRLGRWLSVDPLQGKYPDKSPYNFCSNNPIIFIDPDGKADIYYKGKWIGTDGKNDGIIAVAKSRSVKKEIYKNTKAGMFSDAVGLSNGESNNRFNAIHFSVLSESVKVLGLAIKTKDNRQEHTAVMNETESGGFETIDRNSPPEKIITTASGTTRASGGSLVDGDISIHSHPVGLEVTPENKAKYCDASIPTSNDAFSGSGDLAFFENYDLNIIVGKTGDPTWNRDRGTWEDHRPFQIVVFDSKGTQKMRFDYNESKDMLNSNRNNKRINKFYNKRKD